jgi:hypothetical protein
MGWELTHELAPSMRGIRDLSPLRDAPALVDLIVIEAYHATFSAWWDIPLCKELSLLWQDQDCTSCCRCLGEGYTGFEFRK